MATENMQQQQRHSIKCHEIPNGFVNVMQSPETRECGAPHRSRTALLWTGIVVSIGTGLALESVPRPPTRETGLHDEPSLLGLRRRMATFDIEFARRAIPSRPSDHGLMNTAVVAEGTEEWQRTYAC
jgi:hypothetical protein